MSVVQQCFNSEVNDEEQFQSSTTSAEVIDEKGVPLYDSNSSANFTYLYEPAIKEARKRKDYQLKKTFNTAIEAEQEMSTQTTWSVCRAYNTTEGIKKFYRCNMVKKRTTMFSAIIFIVRKYVR